MQEKKRLAEMMRGGATEAGDAGHLSDDTATLKSETGTVGGNTAPHAQAEGNLVEIGHTGELADIDFMSKIGKTGAMISPTPGHHNSTTAEPGLIEVRDTGTEAGKGLFATKHIPAGTCVLDEEGFLFSSPTAPQALSKIWNEFLKLSESERKAIFDLEAIEDEVTCTWRPHIEAKYKEIVRLREQVAASTGDNFAKAKAQLDKTISEFNVETKVARLIIILRTNCLPLQPDEIEAPQGMQALFPTAARLNHSCCPNLFPHCEETANGKVHYWFHATRDIAEGEELFISYTVPYPGIHCLTHETRNQHLSRWAFQCKCTACTGPEVELHDQRRLSLYHLVNSFSNQWSIVFNDCKTHFADFTGRIKHDPTRKAVGGYPLVKFRYTYKNLLKTLEAAECQDSYVTYHMHRMYIMVMLANRSYMDAIHAAECLISWAEKNTGKASAVSRQMREWAGALKRLMLVQRQDLEEEEERKNKSKELLLGQEEVMVKELLLT